MIFLCLFLGLMTFLNEYSTCNIRNCDTIVHKEILQDTVKQVKLSVRGIIVGGEKKEHLPGAYIYIGENKIPVGTTDENGIFVLDGLPKGKVCISVSYIGFETYSGIYNLTEKIQNLDIGEICLKTVQLEEVTIAAKTPIAVQYGDTTKFNANAVKVAADADLEALLKKLPGFRIVDGRIIAQGKEVKYLYIDGMIYSFNNPSAALHNLPAKLVNKISMYDRGSDEAEFAGYNDGKKYRSLNIETHDPQRPKIFGELLTGYGVTSPIKNTFSQKNYLAHLTGNYFDRKNKITLDFGGENLSQSDNLPKGHFDFEDGYNRSKSTYSNVSRELDNKNTVSVNYSWNDYSTLSSDLSKMEYFPTKQYKNRIYDNENISSYESNYHSLNARFSFNLNRYNKLILAPRFTINKNSSSSQNYGSNVENNDTVNISYTVNNKKTDSYDMDASVMWMHAFHKKGRTFSITFEGCNEKNKTKQFQNNEEHSLKSSSIYVDTVRNFIIGSNRNGYEISIKGRWTETIAEHHRMTFMYNYRQQVEKSDKKSSSYNDSFFQQLLSIDTAQTNTMSTFHYIHNYGFNYDYSFEVFRISANINMSHSEMKNRYQYLGQSDSLTVCHFIDFYPLLTLNYEFNDNSNIDISYSGNSTSPRISQLQDVLIITNPLRVYQGKPDLKKSYVHNLSFTYTMSNPINSAYLHSTLALGQSMNQIASNVRFITKDTVVNGYLLSRGASLTSPVNLNGGWNLSGDISYSFPWEQMKMRLNTSIGYGFSQEPSIYDNLKNMNRSHTGHINVTFSSDISEDIDYNISMNNSFSKSRNTQTGAAKYYNTSIDASVNWVIWKGIFVNLLYGGTFHVTKKENRVAQTENVLDAEIGKKFGSSRKWTLSLSAKDILDNRRSMNYSLSDLYTSTSYSTIPSTCYMLKLVYRFDNMKGE